VTGRRERIPKQTMEKRRCSKLEEEALDGTLWGTRFGGSYRPGVWLTTEWMDGWMNE
jgi:hypothetical protein